VSSLTTTIVRLESSLHCSNPCFCSIAHALTGGCRQSPKFRRRNTLLKTSARVKVAPRGRGLNLDGWHSHASHPQYVGCLGRPRSEATDPKQPRGHGSGVDSPLSTMRMVWRRGWDSCRCATRNERCSLAPSHKCSASRVRIPPACRHHCSPLITLANSIVMVWRRGWDSNPRTA
jgi:hypothetical protein